jgi:glucuronoarabinoxylan endo-1,4-beta-xylanase
MRRFTLLLTLLCATVAPPIAAQTATVSWNIPLQTIDGFGAACDDIGACEAMNTSQAAQVFGTGTGQIGLSIFRDIVPFDGSCSTTCAFRSPNTEAYATQYGLTIFGTPLTPPASMKSNSSVICNAGPGNIGSLLAGSYGAYATYLSNYVSQFRTRYGYAPKFISVQNEPDFCSTDQTFGWGAAWTAAQIDTFVKTNLGPTVPAGTKVMMPETSFFPVGTPPQNGFPSYANTCMLDSSCSQYIGVAASHGYGDTYTTYSNLGSAHYWETENYIPVKPAVYDGSMANALLVAKDIHNWMTVNGNAYMYWRIYNSMSTNDNESLIQPPTGTTPAKRFWAFGNFSKYIRPGWSRITCTAAPTSGWSVTCYKDSSSVNFAIVVINSNTSGGTLTVNGLPSGVSTVTPVITDAGSNNLAPQANVNVSSGSFFYTLTAQSVTTFFGANAGTSCGTLWGCVITNPGRAANWSAAGIPGGLPDTSWPVCQTLSPGATGAAINTALANCHSAHPTGGVVALAAGTYNISDIGINFPVDNIGHLALRGAGAQNTQLNITAAATGCSGVAICMQSPDGTYSSGTLAVSVPHWTTVTGGFAKGSTLINLGSVANITAGVTMLVLNQCDTGYTWNGLATSPCTGTANDNSGYFICSAAWSATNIGCAVSTEGPNGQAYRTWAWQMEGTLVTAVNPAGCTAPCVAISNPIQYPNWALGQGIIAIEIQAQPQVGVENFSIDGTGGQQSGIAMSNTYQAWVSGVRVTNFTQWSITSFQAWNSLWTSNYVFGNPGNVHDSSGFHPRWGGNSLLVNNICQFVSGCMFEDGPEPEDVFAYNYAVGLVPTAGGNTGKFVELHATDGLQLAEGNISFQAMDGDLDHGNHIAVTLFRNLATGYVPAPASQGITSVMSGYADRYWNIVDNVFGTPGYTNTYNNNGNNQFGFKQVYDLGAMATTAGPPGGVLAYNSGVPNFTSMSWGNYDSVHGTTQYNPTEVPTAAPSYPNTTPSVCGSGQSCPASFIYSSQPSFWPSSIPWPAIGGSDISGGNVQACGGTIGTTAMAGLPTTSVNAAKCTSGTTTNAWVGHVNANPAMACAITMGILPDGSNSSASTFNPGSCYGGGTGPVIPPAPTNLTVVAQSSTSSQSNWNVVTIATSYNVYRSTTNGGPYTLLAPNVVSTTYLDSGVPAGVYYYVVTAVNSAGESPKSNQATVTLPPTLLLTAAPASLNFGSVNVGSTSAPQLVTVTNSSSGGSSIAITNVTIGGSNPGDFLLSTPPMIVQHTTIDCGVVTTCATVFTNPVTAGNYIAVGSWDGSGISITPVYTDSQSNSYSVVKQCNVATDLDTMGMGIAKSTAGGVTTVTFADSGHSGAKRMWLAEISGLVSASPVDQTSSCADNTNVSTISAGPISTTVANAMLLAFFSNPGNINGSSYTAGPGYVIIDTITHNPGVREVNEYQNVNTTGSYSASVTLNNGGTTELAGFVVNLKAAAAGINTCNSVTLTAGSSCQFQAAFAPTASGARSATATVNGTVSVNVPLSGTGGAGVPGISLTPAAITFGAQLVSTSSTAVTVTLLNNGTAPLVISSIAMASGVNFSQSNACPGSVAPNASCTINVTFSPTVTGTLNDTVQVNDNAAGTPHTVGVTGTGVSTRAMLSKTAQLSGAVILH